MRWAAALAVLLAAAGCGDDEEPRAPGRGMTRGAEPAPGAAAPATPTAGRDDPLGAPTDPRAGRVRLDQAPDPAAAEAQPGDGEATAPGPDLSAELRRRVGDPSSCLRGLDDLPDEVTLRVSATVSTSGVITRSTVSGPVPSEARDCVTGRLSSARLTGPVEGAPRTVTTSVTVRRHGPE